MLCFNLLNLLQKYIKKASNDVSSDPAVKNLLKNSQKQKIETGLEHLDTELNEVAMTVYYIIMISHMYVNFVQILSSSFFVSYAFCFILIGNNFYFIISILGNLIFLSLCFQEVRHRLFWGKPLRKLNRSLKMLFPNFLEKMFVGKFFTFRNFNFSPKYTYLPNCALDLL